MVQFAGMADIPALQPSGCNLGMKLQAQREVFYGKCLMVILFRLGQMKRAGGKIEGVSMPVEDV